MECANSYVSERLDDRTLHMHVSYTKAKCLEFKPGPATSSQCCKRFAAASMQVAVLPWYATVMLTRLNQEILLLNFNVQLEMVFLFKK